MNRPTAGVVWFKKDLRLADHEPLVRAAAEGPIVCLFIHEPEWWATEECDASHRIFLAECLSELDASLRSSGGVLLLRTGSAVIVLDRLLQEIIVVALAQFEPALGFYQRDEGIVCGVY